jgi:sulfopyruvate decarboxylase subunit alpha
MKPDNAARILTALKRVGVELIVSLPDSFLVDLQILARNDPEIRHILVANEGDGVAICGGAWLGGKKTAMLMENSGLLVAAHALARFHITFGVPTLILASYRGDIGDGNWNLQTFGRVTEPVLQGLGLQYVTLRSAEEIETTITNSERSASGALLPRVVLLGPGNL